MLLKQHILLILIFIIDSTSSKHLNRTCFKTILPSALIIGVKKSGTYALIRYLSINPLVKAALKANNCNLNEIHYFDHDINYVKGVDWYRAQMPSIPCSINDSYISIEKTPGYFRSKLAPERIKHFNSDIKLILIVRDPVKRLQSELTHCEVRQKKFDLEPACANINKYFEQLFQSGLNKTELDRILMENKFIRNSVYYLDMFEWLKYFNLKNFFILNGEAFIGEPWNELNRVESFLNINQFIRKQHFQFDRKKNFYCLMANKILNTTFHGCLGKNKGRKEHVYLSHFVKLNLRAFFNKWNHLFFDLIGKRFNW